MSTASWIYAMEENAVPAEQLPHFHCQRCGARHVVDYPIRADDFSAQANAFLATHRECAVREGAPRPALSPITSELANV